MRDRPPFIPSKAVTERAERIVDAVLDIAGDNGISRRACVDNVGDALEELIGVPDYDHVIGTPVALWDRLRDLRTRLEAVEKIAHAPALLRINEAELELAGYDVRLEAELNDGERDEVADDRIVNEAGEAIAGQGPLIVWPRPGVDRYVLLDFLRLEVPNVAEAAFTTVAEAELIEKRGSLEDGLEVERAEPVTDIFGNRLRVGTEVVFAGDGGALVTGIIEQVDSDGMAVSVSIGGGTARYERHPRNVCARP